MQMFFISEMRNLRKIMFVPISTYLTVDLVSFIKDYSDSQRNRVLNICHRLYGDDLWKSSVAWAYGGWIRALNLCGMLWNNETDIISWKTSELTVVTFISSSTTVFSDSYRLSSNVRPVIFIGPFGISSTVNLNCATNSPATHHHNVRTVNTLCIET